MHCSEHHKIVLYFSLGLVVPFVLASKLALRHTIIRKAELHISTLYFSFGSGDSFCLSFQVSSKAYKIRKAELHKGQSCFLKSPNGMHGKTVM